MENYKIPEAEPNEEMLALLVGSLSLKEYCVMAMAVNYILDQKSKGLFVPLTHDAFPQQMEQMLELAVPLREKLVAIMCAFIGDKAAKEALQMAMEMAEQHVRGERGTKH